MPLTLPSGLPASALGLDLDGDEARLPLGLVVPEGEGSDRVLALAPSGRERPAWWSGHATRQRAHVLVSTGAISLNRQVLPILQAAESAGVRALAIMAPAINDEALVTLLVNDLAGVFPEGILPLQTIVPEYHVEEVVQAIAEYLGLDPWDGRPGSVCFARVERLDADAGQTRVVRTRPHSLASALSGLLRR